tara:strand:- start:158 stop:265 length:108 start_codon:yes stop_codon:yes gene_type:complete
MTIIEQIMEENNIEQKMMVAEAHIRIVDRRLELKA